MGTPELPGIKRRVYYISKNQVAQWPTFIRDDNGRVTSSTLAGSFTLVADAKWHFIVILADKSQLTSDAQGEVPSQTQLNKATLVHPGVGPEATAAAAYLCFRNTERIRCFSQESIINCDFQHFFA